jgi:nitroreductase
VYLPFLWFGEIKGLEFAKRGEYQMNSDQILSALNWRYATKKYDATKKLSEADWATLKESLRLAPSSYGLQPWKFIEVNNPEVRKKLRAVSWDQSIIEESAKLVVFTTLREMSKEHIQKFINSMATARKIPASNLDGYKQMMEQNILVGKPKETHLAWNQRQAYIAMGFLLETASLLKIDATPVEGLAPEDYDKILGLTGTPYTTVAVVTLGYRDASDSYQSAAKSRFSEQEIFEVV